MKTTIICLLFVLFTYANASSQDTLVLLDGKTVTGEIIFTKDYEISMVSHGKFYKTEHTYYKDEIFSVSRGLTKTILYTPDSSAEKRFSVVQMAAFIEGLKDGRKNYHAPLATIGGFATGATGGFFGFWGMTIPAAYVFAAGIKTPKLEMEMPVLTNEIAIMPEPKTIGLKYTSVNKESAVCEESTIPYYKYGYETAAKDKKIKNAIFGSVAGFVSLAITSYILMAR